MKTMADRPTGVSLSLSLPLSFLLSPPKTSKKYPFTYESVTNYAIFIVLR